MARRAAFQKSPLSFFEDPREERERLERLRQDDPIALQDALNTSRALIEAVKAGSVEELQSVVESAEEGEFLQVFILQAIVLALKSASLEIVKQMRAYCAPFVHEQLAEVLHVVCEVTTRDNFSDAWRIVELLTQGVGPDFLTIDQPRAGDGWTPLCIACADACLPLTFKLLELQADPNIVTRASETPLSLAKRRLADDNAERKEARDIICSMLRHYGGQERWQDALKASHKPRVKLPATVEEDTRAE